MPPSQQEWSVADSFGSVVAIEANLTPERLERRVSHGTGLVWDREGHILTAAHVFEGVSPRWSVDVYLAERRYAASIAFPPDKQKDLLILRLRNAEWPLQMRLWSEWVREPRLGEPVYVVGFPRNEYQIDRRPTVTSGIISGTARSVVDAEGHQLGLFAMTDAFASIGSSGALVVGKDGVHS
jgi:putative serine protease PepD